MPLTPALQAFRNSFIEGQSLVASSEAFIHMGVLTIIYFVIGSIGIKKAEKIIMEKNLG
jgi:ABC-type polysaccharide/polyol phosphate export permease